ncbi:DUF4232 domain-containing protein [Streptomyces sp. NPDC020681]|uniref:DUF4232 domain-containing protein n=1 Tax=Streptomyces sp. NPDC020681 TaxID=3365083 RepID=UPI0037A5B27B
MNRTRRKAFLVSVSLLGGVMLMTACLGTDTDASPPKSYDKGSGTPEGGGPNGGGTEGGTGTGTGSGSGADTGADTGIGERAEVGQTCGANDLSWNARSEGQAGGYILITAKAKSGITCALPAELPTVAFGSGGTEARPAERPTAKRITLSGSTTAYAGVNPKNTPGNGGKGLDSVIVAVGNDDPNPVSLPINTMTVDDPVVTNWHTSASAAVPFGT